MKLELKHLAPYCIHGLKGKLFDNIDIVTGLDFEHNIIETLNNNNCLIENFKPILRPLSDLTKEHLSILFGYDTEDDIVDFEIITTPFNEFGYIEYSLFGIGHISTCIAGYNELQKLLSEHWDLFGLIDKGLAIDINKL